MRSHAGCLLAAALLVACNRGPLPLDPQDDTGTGETGELPDLPAPLPSCESFGQTRSAWVVSDALDRYKVPGGVLAGEDQMLAVWRRGFNGSNPDPNLMARPLDVDGQPLGPSFALSERNVPNGPFVRPSSDGYWLLTQCARFGYEDRAAPFRIDVTGNVSEDMFVIPPDDQFCGAHDPLGIWTGQRHMVSWTDNSTDELRLAVMGEQLDDVSTTLLAPDGDLSVPPRFAISQETVILAAGLEQDRISIWYSSLDGELLGDPTEVIFEIESEGPADLAITPTSDGAIVWVVGRWNGGLYRIDLDANGELLSGPNPVPGWEGWLLDDSDVSPAPGGYMMGFTAWDLENNFIVWAHVGADGVLGQPQVYGDELDDFYIANPRLNAREGRIFMSYSASLDANGELFEIRLTEFGCVE